MILREPWPADRSARGSRDRTQWPRTPHRRRAGQRQALSQCRERGGSVQGDRAPVQRAEASVAHRRLCNWIDEGGAQFSQSFQQSAAPRSRKDG
jgi:hypothetical protein